MLNGEEVDRVWLGEVGSGDAKGVVDLGGEGIEVVLGVEIKVNAMVTQRFHVSLAARGNVTLRVRGAHVGWVFSDDVGDCTLILHHLLHALVVGDV